jgi:hypothetical protein
LQRPIADKIRKIEALIVSTLPEKANAGLLSFCNTAPARKKVTQSIEYSVKNDNRDVERGVILRWRLTGAFRLLRRPQLFEAAVWFNFSLL